MKGTFQPCLLIAITNLKYKKNEREATKFIEAH